MAFQKFKGNKTQPVFIQWICGPGKDSSDHEFGRQRFCSRISRVVSIPNYIADLKIAGKTGTAQNPHGPDHGWFIGFAPADAPTIAVGAVVEFAEHGSSVAPLVTRIMARYLLGADAVRARGPAITIEAPADTAPAPLPILPDSTFLRNQGRDSLGTTAPRTR